jgi:translation elongation factor EF-Tu-like GTPase
MMDKKHELSLRICACRSLVHFIKKVDVEQIENLFEYISSILYNVDELLTLCNEETIHIPVAAMKQLSKMNEEAVAKIAHESAPHLLKLFEYYHDQPLIGPDLLEIFKMWTNYET